MRPSPALRIIVGAAFAPLLGVSCVRSQPAVEIDLGARSMGGVAIVDASSSSVVERAVPPIRFEPWNDELAARARSSRRPVLLVVCAAWTVRCTALDRDVLKSPEVARMAQAYVAARFDATDATSAVDVELRRLGVETFPVIVLLDEEAGAREMIRTDVSAEELANALDRFARRE